MSRLKEIMAKIEEIKLERAEVSDHLAKVDKLTGDLENLLNLGVKGGDLLTALSLANSTVRVLGLMQELDEEEE